MEAKQRNQGYPSVFTAMDLALCADSQLGRRSQTTNPAVNHCTKLIYSDFMQGIRLFVHYSIYYQT